MSRVGRSWRTIRRLTSRSLVALLAIVTGAVVIDLGERVWRGGVVPLLPYRYTAGAPTLPPTADIRAQFPGQPAIRYCTDAGGARIASPAARSAAPPAVFVLGDSQPLGYMLEFPDTFAADLARRLHHTDDAARILASPASDVEASRFALERYGLDRVGSPELAVICVNLANDFDEMFHGGQDGRGDDTPPLHAWLLEHSYLAMHAAIAYAKSPRVERAPPGVSRVLYTLEADERIALVDQTVKAIAEIAALLQRARRVIVLLIPADYQVDPAQFAKYRPYYAPSQHFDRWLARADELASMLNVLESYMARRLKSAGLRVVRVDEAIAGRPAAQMFQPTDHHLTAAAHALVADALLREFNSP